MQSNSVYLYSNKIDIYADSLADWVKERFRRVYNRNLKIYRSVDNRIDIQVRNSDQKPLSIGDSFLVFNLFSKDGEKLILNKDCQIQSRQSGTATIFVTRDEMLDIENGFYNYSFTCETRQYINELEYTVTGKYPTYMDSQYGAVGIVEVVGDVLGNFQPSIYVDKFALTDPATTGEPEQKFYVSSIIDPKRQTSTAASLHTFQFYTTNYSGTINIQGSLDEYAEPKNWIDLKTISVTNSNIKYENVKGKYNWLRVKHTPNSATVRGSFTVSQTILLTYQVSINQAGQGYSVGDTILINGNRLGGESITNDLLITVESVDLLGAITVISWTGLSYNGIKTFVVDAVSPEIGTVDKILYR